MGEKKMDCPVFVINLKKDLKKRDTMQSMADRYAYKLNFIDAVYGKDLDQGYIDSVCNHEESIKLFNRPLFRGEVGVALSQMSIYKKMLDEDIEQAIIFEDDVIFDDSLGEVIKHIDDFPKDLELILLGYHRGFISNTKYRISFREKKQISKNFKVVRFTDKMDGAFAYLITKKGAKKLYDILNKSIIKAVDNYTGDDSYINLYGLWPKCVHVDASLESTINEERKMFNTQSAKKKELSGVKRVLNSLGNFRPLQLLMGKYMEIKNELKHLPLILKKPKKYEL